MGLTHIHYCKHCDRNFTCKLAWKCLLDYDISKLHKCQNAMVYRKRIVMMLSNDADVTCAYGCSRVCNHPAIGELDNIIANASRAIVKINAATAIRAVAPETAVNAPGSHVAALSSGTDANVPTVALAFVSGVPASEFDQRGGVREPQSAIERTKRRTNAIIAMSKRG